MKKKLFLALLTTLLLLLATSAALAVSPSDFNCIKCGEPCTEWYAAISNDGTTHNHSPLCRTCWAIVWYVQFPCTPVEGTATCIQADLCSVCGYPDSINSAPNPNAHNMSEWGYRTSTQHFRYCQNCYAADTYEYEDHYGGTATCVMQAICEGCGEPYGELDNTRHGNNYSSWDYHSAAQHERYCLDCGGIAEYEDHYGGTATCIDLAICEGCGIGYGEHSTKHAMSEWVPVSLSQHRKNCTLCWDPETIFYEDHSGGTATCIARAVCEVCDASYGDPVPDAHMWSEWTPGASGTHYRYCGLNAQHIEYGVCSGDWFWVNDKVHGFVCSTCENRQVAEHTGGTATCIAPAVCEVCSEGYGELSDKHLNMSDWFYVNAEQHLRYCRDCFSSDSYEYEDHYGGDGSCRPTCEGCGQRHYDADGEHRSMSDWAPLDDTEHYRLCSDCSTSDSLESEDHYGGTATCTQKAVCEGCSTAYGARSDVHPWGEWQPYNVSGHIRYCTNPDCNASDYANHSGGGDSCLPVCEDCGTHYYNEDGQHRNMSVWYLLNDTQHMRHCADCGYGQEYEDHNGGTATCSEKAVCEVCGEGYGELDDTRHGDFSDWEAYDETQHYRWCLDCGSAESFEYEDHYGGSASCHDWAICEGCGISYGDLARDVHLHMSEWAPRSDGHERFCLDCRLPTSFERAPHTDDGTCMSTCIDCGATYYDSDGEHHLTDWIPENNTQHGRYCDRCYGESTYEYAAHVGDGTCTTQCKDCGDSFTDPDGTHSLTEWSPYSNKEHVRYCQNCRLESTYEYGDHKASVNADTLPCYKTFTCGDCGINMGFGTQHPLSEWIPYSPLQHMRYCTAGGTAHVEEYDLHSGGDGSCTPVCEGCGEPYIPLNGAHQWGEWTPNADGTHTRVCALNEEHTETADCTFGDWALADDQYHIRACTDCGDEETGEHSGGTATCSTPRICDICNEGYGSPDNSGLTGHPNPTIEEKPGTCYDEGYYRITCDEPGCTMPFFEIATPANGQHLYNHWDVLGENRHHTDCAQCGENVDVACTLWGLYEGETLLSVCPVCGDFAEALFEVLLARDDVAVPIGTLLVRGLAEPIDGALFGFTVAGVYGGEVVDIHGTVTITIPVECEGFTVIRVEIVDGAEVRTEIPFTLDNGQLTIETDAAGLFLLVPAE